MNLGVWGERYAANYVTGLGWQVVDRNWRCRWGELDIVALDESGAGAVVVAIEVKSRAGLGYGDPLEAITVAKAARIRQLLGRWLREHPGRYGGIRVDAIGILAPPGSSPRLRHVRGVA